MPPRPIWASPTLWLVEFGEQGQMLALKGLHPRHPLPPWGGRFLILSTETCPSHTKENTVPAPVWRMWHSFKTSQLFYSPALEDFKNIKALKSKASCYKFISTPQVLGGRGRENIKIQWKVAENALKILRLWEENKLEGLEGWAKNCFRFA